MLMKRKLALFFLQYLRILAKIQLSKINLIRKIRGKRKVIIIGITGSIGKTSTMIAIVSALKDSFKVKYSQKANSESGIPLDILGLQIKNYSVIDWLRVALLSPVKIITNWQEYDIYVVEMGVDEPYEPKNMGYLLKIIRPEIGVFIGVTSVHSQQFEKVALGINGVLNAIADEKAKLIISLPESGFAVLNPNDELVKNRAHLTKAKVVFAKNVMVDFRNYILPKPYQINFGLALATAESLGVSKEKALLGIKKYFYLPPGRSSLIKGIKDTLIIDSSYNSSLKASLAMLDLLRDYGIKTGRRKIAVLGDMRELGNQSETEHQKLAEAAVKTADEVVLVGSEMKKYFLPKAKSLGFKNINHFENAYQAAKFLKNNLKGRGLVLIKGSQNTIFLEIVVKALMKEKNKAKSLLCRQEEFWERKRKLLRKEG